MANRYSGQYKNQPPQLDPKRRRRVWWTVLITALVAAGFYVAFFLNLFLRH